MGSGHPLSLGQLPRLWLLSDERNDAVLDQGLRSFSDPIAFVFRHYHLPPAHRFARWQELRRIALAQGHLVILADDARTAREWGADGIYGAPLALYPHRRDLLMIATAHNMREIGQANRIGADAVMLSPVFPTRSHPGARTLGATRFRHMARHSTVPVVALGGMSSCTASRLDWPRWAAIDGLS